MAKASIFRPDIFADRTVLVTGGGTGICKSIAQAYAAHGACVCITSRKQENLDEAKAEIEAATGSEVLAMAADVRDYSAVEQVVAATLERFGGIDVVVNGAAGNFPCPVASLSPNGFNTILQIDTQGTFNVTKACFEPLQEAAKLRGDASVLAISATFPITGMVFQAHVTAAKAGVEGFMRSIALEWGPLGIRANCIAPGLIGDTEGQRRLAPDERGIEQALGAQAIRRVGTKQEIADACLFLSSDASRFTTGVTLIVDGAGWMGSPVTVGL